MSKEQLEKKKESAAATVDQIFSPQNENLNLCMVAVSLLQDHLPVKFQGMKFKLKFKHEFVCNQNFSVVEIIELFVVCQKLIHVYAVI